MLTTAVALCIALQSPDDRLKDNFGKLQEAWKSVAARKDAAKIDDDTLRAFGKIAAAYEAAGFFEADLTFDARALKKLLGRKAETRMPAARSNSTQRIRIIAGGGFKAEPETPQYSGDALGRFEKSIARLAELKAKGADDEDNAQETLVEARKALKDLGLIRDEQPQWQRRRILGLARAVASGGAYPAMQKATPEQEKRVKELIVQLGDGEVEKRDEASRELDKLGEPAVPFLHEALKHADTEVRERAKKLLGIGLKEEQSRAPEPEDEFEHVFKVEVVPAEKEDK